LPEQFPGWFPKATEPGRPTTRVRQAAADRVVPGRTLHCPRHRWLRAQRHPRGLARLLRGRSSPRRAGRAHGAARPGCDPGVHVRDAIARYRLSADALPPWLA